jgi:hypothetical protein
MFDSKNKLVFDLIVSKLNDNTQDVTFDGNFMFEFSRAGDNNFNIKTLSELEYVETEIVPVVDVQSIQIPYVESNDRDDWERELYFAIYIPETEHSVTGEQVIEFDYTNARYQAILETINTFESTLTFTSGSYKYSFKVKEPTKVGVFTYNGKYYQILAMTFNLTSLQSGFFGNETKMYFGLKSDTSFAMTSDYQIDFVSFTEIVGKTSRPNSSVNETEETYSVDKRTWEANVTCNFNGNTADILLYKEKKATATIDTLYQIKISNSALNTYVSENLDYTYDVTVKDINVVYRNNVVDQITFKVQRA